MHTVELLLSDDLETAVRSLWHRLHAAGLPSLATHTHPTNRPHLTLVAAESVPQHLDFGLPLPVTLGGVRMLGKALVREVVASCELRTLQAAVWQSCSGANPLHVPGAWLPHVSLALNVRADRRAAALG
ncbi:2'-5' RNA ligase family protein, partial [Actinoplanes sp. NPDC051633]|uniref:2'-5' RNA ligase family protein n=1 Tax=Actinoplanes sp. NPDC051633 TaxID=3155670 RepID=UPI003440C49B